MTENTALLHCNGCRDVVEQEPSRRTGRYGTEYYVCERGHENAASKTSEDGYKAISQSRKQGLYL